MTTFWGEQRPNDRIIQGSEDPSELLVSSGPIMPDRVRLPEGTPFGLAGQERSVLRTEPLPCPSCETPSPWHHLGACEGGQLLLCQCLGACGWLLMVDDREQSSCN